MSRWPAIRTLKDPPRHLRARAAVFGAAGACLLPFLVGLLALLSGNLTQMLGAGETTSDGFMVLAVMLVPSLLFSVPSAMLAVPIAMIAMRYGWAGWLAAILAGGLMTLFVFGFVLGIRNEGLPVAFGIGVIFGGIFWVCARLWMPEVFLEEPGAT